MGKKRGRQEQEHGPSKRPKIEVCELLMVLTASLKAEACPAHRAHPVAPPLGGPPRPGDMVVVRDEQSPHYVEDYPGVVTAVEEDGSLTGALHCPLPAAGGAAGAAALSPSVTAGPCA